MSAKSPRLSLVFIILIITLLAFPLTRMCLADVRGNLQVAGDKVLSLIKTGDFTAAGAAVKQLKVNFKNDPGLPEQLYDIACKYYESGRGDIARALYQDVSRNYSKVNPHRATLAGMWVSRLKICDLIDAGDYAAAESSIKQMKADFAKSEDLADHLLHFAWRCEQQGQRVLARELYQDVSQNYSKVDPDRAAFASLWARRFNIYNLIDAGDYTAAKSSVKQIKVDFAGNRELADHLYNIAWKYYENNQKDLAKVLYQDVSRNYSELDPYRATLAGMWVSRLNICDLIDTGDYAAARLSIKQMKADSPKNEHLADHLLRFAWKCEQSGQRVLARELYQDVSQNYSEVNPHQSSTAAMYTAIIDVDICKLVDMSDEVAVGAAITHLKYEFSSTNEPSYVMYSLAKVLHREALAISADSQYDTAKVKDYLKQAITIYENEVIGKTSRADLESEAYRVSAQSYEILGDYAKSVEYCQRLINKFPNSKMANDARVQAGRILYFQGAYQESVDAFKAVLSNSPSETLRKEAEQNIKDIERVFLNKNKGGQS